ncbi:MAG: hypothetical protein HY554_18340 [Elusimicrobia bacterium]|nr:hypothetical protein [Elusimicrobiota bacterium]
MAWSGARLIGSKRSPRSLPFVLSAFAVLFLTALPWTPPARPDRDLGLGESRRVSAVRNGGRPDLGRLYADPASPFDAEAGWRSAPFALCGPGPLPLPGLRPVSPAPWAPFSLSSLLSRASSCRGPPAA